MKRWAAESGGMKNITAIQRIPAPTHPARSHVCGSHNIWPPDMRPNSGRWRSASLIPLANLQDEDKLFFDNISATDRHIARFKLTYNSALMIRAELGLYRATGNPANLKAAKEVAAACDAFVNPKTGGYRDAIRFSHLLVEADLAMYRTDGDAHLLSRARRAVDADYAAWRDHPSNQLLDIAALARELWLLAESHSPAGKAFWKRVDQPVAVHSTVKDPPASKSLITEGLK